MGVVVGGIDIERGLELRAREERPAGSVVRARERLANGSLVGFVRTSAFEHHGRLMGAPFGEQRQTLRQQRVRGLRAHAIQAAVAAISPFRGLRYDLDVVGDLGTVTSPPYDVIPPDQHEQFERASPYNVVRLILGRQEAGSDQYTRAAATLDAWIRDGVLRMDDRETITVYEQRFIAGGRERLQRGVLVAAEIEDEPRSILPHERTMAGPVEDRLKLVRATRTNLSPVFAVYSSEDGGAREVVGRTAERAPWAAWESEDDGVAHRAWPVDDANDIETIRRTLESAVVVIADGHHRYRTAQEYHSERRATDGPGPWDSMLFYLVDAAWFGPALLPIHRAVGMPAQEILSRVADAFDVEPADGSDADALAADLERRREQGRTFVLLGADGAHWLTVADKAAEADAMPSQRSPVWRDLDVAVLEWFVFRRLLGGAEARYVHHPAEAAELVTSGAAGAAFLLAHPPFESVRGIAEAGDAMPPKSTFFVPKPRTGVVLRPLG